MTAPTEASTWRDRLRTWAAPGLLGLYSLLLFGGTAFLQAGLFERDGYFHARFAALMPVRGLSRAFPWTQLSTWREQFCDKEFLYHLAMLPFTLIGADPMLGARVFGVLLSVAVVAVFYAVLRAHRVRFPAFFAALPLATGGLFIARLGMIRSHVLSMLLLTLGLHFLLQKRWRALFILGFVYAWCYTVPFVLVLTAVPFTVGLWMGGARLDLRLPLAAGAGSVLGLALHPYSPLTLETLFTYLQVFRLGLQGAASSGFELGNELYPYSWPIFWDIYPLLLLLVAALPPALFLARKRLTPGTLGLALAALFWFAMTAASPRFAEYSVLLVAAAWALLLRDAWPALAALEPWRRPRLRLLAAGLALAALVGFHARSLRFYRIYQSDFAPARFFTGACAWMSQNLAPGETVINLYWDDFPDLFYDGSRQTFLWGLDPTYSIREDPTRARALEDYRRGRIPLDAGQLKELFRANHLVLRPARAARYPALGRPPFREVYRDATAVVFALE